MTPVEAELYQALHRGSPGDLQFYQQACEGAGSLLELGCGYGRLLQGLGKPGRRLVGLDQDASLLHLATQIDARDAEIQWLHGDMCAIDLDQRFDCVLLAFNTFFCIPHRKKAQLLQAIHRHLKPGGILLMDAYRVPDEDQSGVERFSPPEPIVRLSLDQGLVDVFEESQEDYGEKTIQVTYTFRRDGRLIGSQFIEHAYWYEHEFQPALKHCGFESVIQTHGFGVEPTQVVIEARR